MRLIVAALLAGSAALSPLAAQNPPSRAQQNETEAYAEYKKREFAENRNALSSAGRLPTLEAMLQLAKQQSPFKDKRVRGGTAQEQGIVRDLLDETVAYYLVSAGLTPADVRSAQQAGLDPLQSTARLIGGQGAATDRAAVSEFVFVGNVIEAQESTDKTYNSLIKVKVDREVKTTAGRPLPAEIEIELDNPFLLIGRERVSRGQSFVFFVSDSLNTYRSLRGLNRGKPRSQVFLMQLAPYRLEGDRMIPTDKDPIMRYPAESLQAFLSATAQLERGAAPATGN